MVIERASETHFLARADLDRLIGLLRDEGRTVIGPTIREDAIVYDEVRSIDDLPSGWRDDQAPGRYRISPGHGDRLFDFTVGPTSWKRYTFPPSIRLATGRRDGPEISFEPAVPDPPRLAFLGVRGCEIAALGIQDRVLTGGQFIDRDYASRRSSALIIAAQCTRAGATCFCTSMGTGPEVRHGFDLALTETDDGFIVAVGSTAGQRLLDRLPVSPATPQQQAAAVSAVAATRAAIGNPVAAGGLHDRLMDQLDSPRWAEVADRCLACANCTMVCPTCFCTSVTQASDLDGAENITRREWDSCFSLGFAKVAGGNFRPRRQDRYRQWLTHKFATWFDQFGSSGCVGCGRCITWCPVAIDVREELAVIAPPYENVALAKVAPAATSPGRYVVATISSVRAETSDTSTLRLRPADPAILSARPGQFVMLELPGFPPLPISVSRVTADEVWLTIRAVGPATTAIVGLGAGRQIGMRGPLGRGWPVERAIGRDVVIVAGGIGLAPLRPLIDAVAADRDSFGRILLAYGARTPAERLYPDELDAWTNTGIEVAQIVDRAGPEWLGRVGVVTGLLDQREWDPAATAAFVCGPERMMQATATTLAERGVAPERTFVSLERHMQCGIGLCGHCQMGPFFICRDGPVFALPEVASVFGQEGI